MARQIVKETRVVPPSPQSKHLIEVTVVHQVTQKIARIDGKQLREAFDIPFNARITVEAVESMDVGDIIDMDDEPLTISWEETTHADQTLMRR